MPYGRKMRFIPFTADPMGIEPLEDLMQEVTAAIIKQKRFVEATTVYRSYGIRKLDHSITYGDTKVSICEALLCMKASDHVTNLFEGVEKNRDGIVFLFHSSLQKEASHVISYTPIILEQKFPRASEWFTEEKLFQVPPYYWDQHDR